MHQVIIHSRNSFSWDWVKIPPRFPLTNYHRRCTPRVYILKSSILAPIYTTTSPHQCTNIPPSQKLGLDLDPFPTIRTYPLPSCAIGKTSSLCAATAQIAFSHIATLLGRILCTSATAWKSSRILGCSRLPASLATMLCAQQCRRTSLLKNGSRFGWRLGHGLWWVSGWCCTSVCVHHPLWGVKVITSGRTRLRGWRVAVLVCIIGARFWNPRVYSMNKVRSAWCKSSWSPSSLVSILIDTFSRCSYTSSMRWVCAMCCV